MQEQESQVPPVNPQTPVVSDNPASPAKSYYGKKNWKKWVLIYLIIGAVLYAGVYYFFLAKQSDNPYSNTQPTTALIQKACTQEAKICADGSSVGRSGPNCEFAACPATPATSSADMTNWKTYTNQYFSIRYPQIYVEDKGVFHGSSVALVELAKIIPETGKQQYESNRLTITVFTQTYDAQKDVEDLIKIEKTENISIDGVQGIKYAGLSKVNSAATDWIRSIVYLKNKGNQYIFMLTTSKDKLDELDQILSTFTFIK